MAKNSANTFYSVQNVWIRAEICNSVQLQLQEIQFDWSRNIAIQNKAIMCNKKVVWSDMLYVQCGKKLDINHWALSVVNLLIVIVNVIAVHTVWALYCLNYFLCIWLTSNWIYTCVISRAKIAFTEKCIIITLIWRLPIPLSGLPNQVGNW